MTISDLDLCNLTSVGAEATLRHAKYFDLANELEIARAEADGMTYACRKLSIPSKKMFDAPRPVIGCSEELFRSMWGRQAAAVSAFRALESKALALRDAAREKRDSSLTWLEIEERIAT